MNCSLCNGNIIIKNDFLQFRSKALGEINVPDVHFEECQGCGKKLLSPDAADYVTGYVKEQEQIAIGNLPASDLVTATQAAAILGVTKQAFSKKPKIKRGFVYFVMVGNRRAYFKKSIDLFKQTGDGRFRLNTPTATAAMIYIATPSWPHIDPPEYVPQEIPEVDSIWCNEATLTIRTGNDCTN